MQNNKCDLKANCIDYELYITIILISDKSLNVNYSPVKNDYNNQQLRNDKVYEFDDIVFYHAQLIQTTLSFNIEMIE